MILHIKKHVSLILLKLSAFCNRRSSQNLTRKILNSPLNIDVNPFKFGFGYFIISWKPGSRYTKIMIRIKLFFLVK